MEVSIVIPAYNEAETVGGVLLEVLSRFHRGEILVVDNNSTDETPNIIKSMVKAYPGRLKYIFEKKAGKGYALRAGFKSAVGSIIVMMDADGSHMPSSLKDILRPLEKKEVGIVVASRFSGGSGEYTPVRMLGNLLLSTTFCALFNQRYFDVLNGYKAFRREVFDKFDYKSSEFEIEIELASNALKLGYDVVDIPSYERERAGGKMKSFAPKHGTKFLLKILSEAIKYRIYRVVNKNRKY